MIPEDLEVWPDDEEGGVLTSGFLGSTRHDFDDHRQCDPDACPNAEQATP